MTILRSIDFSRATASAICSSSSRFALTPACAMLRHPPLSTLAPRRPRCRRDRAFAFFARRSVSRMSSSVSTSRASAIEAIGRPMTWRRPGRARPRRDLARLRRPRARRGTACGPRSAPSSRSWPRARPRPRNRTAAPAACRCRARRSRACTGPGSGRAHRAAGDKLREMSAHSSTVIVPSGRSAMICTVVPLRPETATRTSRKPRSLSTGSTRAAISAANAGLANEARVGRRAAHRSQPCEYSSCSRLGMLSRPPKTKRADPKGPLSELR